MKPETKRKWDALKPGETMEIPVAELPGKQLPKGAGKMGFDGKAYTMEPINETLYPHLKVTRVK